MFAVCLFVGGFSLCYNKDVTDDGTVSLNPFLGHNSILKLISVL